MNSIYTSRYTKEYIEEKLNWCYFFISLRNDYLWKKIQLLLPEIAISGILTH